MTSTIQYNILSINTPRGLILSRTDKTIKDDLDYWINDKGHREFYCESCRKLVSLVPGSTQIKVAGAVHHNFGFSVKVSFTCCSDRCINNLPDKYCSQEGIQRLLKIHEIVYNM